jgi:two-component system response regulator YesN
VTVADAARAVDLTLPYFSTLFTEETGRNPSDFLIGLRIERAKEYLAHTTLSVVQVADLLGYSSPSHFSRLFKKRTGCPPSYFMRSLPSD